jgi:hypothetical protein
MMGTMWLVIALIAVAVLACRVRRVWIDAGRRQIELPSWLGRALLGAAVPSRYWWGTRIEALTPLEQDDLLLRETAALKLSRVDSPRCPLCGAEVPHAWALTPEGKPAIAPGPVECPACDWRLDACRHCTHFLPGPPPGWGQSAWLDGDRTSSRCRQYKAWQPVEQACAPSIAAQMKKRTALLHLLLPPLPPEAAWDKRLPSGEEQWLL